MRSSNLRQAAAISPFKTPVTSTDQQVTLLLECLLRIEQHLATMAAATQESARLQQLHQLSPVK